MANRYPLIVDETIKEIVAGDTLVADNLLLSGTTPTLTIGDAGAEDTKIVFDGNAQDFYIGLDDSADDLVIGLGSAVGTTPAISIDENQQVTFTQNIVVSGTVDGVDIATRDALLTSTISDVALKATIANPTLTGTPAAPTASGSTNTTQLATTAFVQQELTTLIGGAPSTLNDLNELAAAINDDANYNSTLTTALATKLPLAGGTMTGTLTANAGVVVDNITIDGNEIDCSSGNLTIDVAGDILLNADGGDITLQDGGSSFGNLKNDSSNFMIQSLLEDYDIIFRGNDGNSDVNALRLDMSDAGTAIFNHDASFPDGAYVKMGAGSDLSINSDGTNGRIFADNGDLTLDVAGDIILDADTQGEGNGILLKDSGITYGNIFRTGSDLVVMSSASDEDLIFKGNDGGSTITALTLDMSEAGEATFNDSIHVNGPSTITTANNLDTLSLISTDADENSGPRLSLTRNSASPADNDYVGIIAFNGENSADESIRMGMIRTQVLDVTDGTEDSTLTFYSRHGGTETQRLATTSTGIDVTGTATMDGLTVVTNTDVWTGEFTQSNTSNGDGVLVEVGSTAAADYALSVRTSAGNHPAFNVKADGNVGIGIFSPLDILHLNDPNDDCVLNLDTAIANKNSMIKFSDPDAQGRGFIQYAHSDGSFRITVEGGENLRINSTGYVDMVGANQVRLSLGSTGTAGTNTCNWIRGNSGYLQYNSASDGHTWEIGGTERLRIAPAGQIGIGGANYGTDGQVLTSTGASSAPAWEDAGGGGAYSDWLVKTANFTCASGDQLICNHASTAFTITLPTGAAGATVVIANAGAATVTIGRNSSNINSAAADGTLPQGNSVQLVYVDSTIGWFEV